jgi:integrase
MAGKTVLSYLKDIGSIYRAAIREGIIAFNPVAACEKPDTSDSHERKPFTFDEVEKLKAAAPSEQWRGMILAAAFTGLRLGDVARLKWDCVDLEKKMITVIPAKTKRKKVEVKIPIHPDLLAYLTAAPVADDSPDAFVFPELAQKKIETGNGLSETFNRIMQAAGVDRGKPSREKSESKEKSRGRVTYERGFHSLRHTFTTWLYAADVSEEDRMLLTGHSTRDAHRIYSHADESILRRAMDKLSTLKGQSK